MKKRLLCVLLTFCMVLTLIPTSALADKQDSEAELPSDTQMKNTEESASLLDAGDTMTRGAWMHELVPLFGLTLTRDLYPDVYFPDIADSEYFDDIMIATKYGLVDVEAGDNFEPDAPLTREFAAHTLNYYLGIQNDKEHYTFNDVVSMTYPNDAQVAVDNGWFLLNGGAFSAHTAVTVEEISAMKASASDVLERRRTDSEKSDYQFADYVKEIPSSANIDSTLDLESGITTLTISGYKGTLVPNDTIVFYSDGFAFVYGVESARYSDGVFTVITKDAPSGAIHSFDFIGNLNLDLSPDIRDNAPVTLMCSDGEEIYFEEVQLFSLGKNSITFSRDFIKGEDNGISGKIKGSVKNLRIDSRFTGGKKYFALLGDLEVTSTMEMDLLNDPKAASLPLGGISLGPFGYAGLEINLKMDAKIAYTTSYSFRIGLDYQDGRKSWIKELDTKDSSLSADGTVSAQLALAAHLSFGANGSATVSLGSGPRLEAKYKRYSDGLPQTCITLSGYLYAGFETRVKFKEIISGEVIIDCKYSYDFYTYQNSPIRFYKHIEDGIEVFKCNRENDSGISDDNYFVPKYYTPATSNYLSGSFPHADSTGYGGYGSGDVVIWETAQNDDGTLTITAYNGNTSILHIPERIDGKIVSSIGERVFSENSRLRMVYFSDYIKNIGSGAFSNCSNLSYVEFGSNITDIGDYAFYSCSNLQNIDLCDRTESIGVYSFYECSQFTSLHLPEQLNTIGSFAFGNCNNLQEVSIPGSLTYYKGYESGPLNTLISYDGPFENCTNLSKIQFDTNVTIILPYLFKNCSGITDIEIPDSITAIGAYAFSNCDNLVNLKIGENVSEIYQHAFSNCSSLQEVIIPNSVNMIENYAFYQCEKLENVQFGTSVEVIGCFAFYECDSLASVVLPEGLITLGSLAFGNCNLLQRINIPSTLSYFRGYEQSVGWFTEMRYDGAFENCEKLCHIDFSEDLPVIVPYLFKNCPGLSKIEIPETITAIGGYAFTGCKNLDEVTIGDNVTDIYQYAFSDCTKLKNISLPDSLENLYNNAFDGCNNLASIEFGNGLKTIGVEAFQYCASLTSAHLPDGLTTLGSYAFRDCTSLQTVYIPGTINEIIIWESGTWAIPDAFEGPFYHCDHLTSVEFSDSIKIIPQYLFQDCTGLREIIIPESVEEIANHAFADCINLDNITIHGDLKEVDEYSFSGCALLSDLSFLPASVNVIRDGAFEECLALIRADLPKSVVKIGDYTFSGCKSLISFTADSNLFSIGNYAFLNCNNLTVATLNQGLNTIGSYAFQNCTSLESISLPESIISLGSYCFQKNSALKDLTLSSNLTMIPSYAFANCTALEKLEIPNGITTIEDHAFYQDTKLKTFVIPDTVSRIEDNAFSYATTTTVYGVPGSYAETYAKWAAFIDIAEYRKTGTMGNSQEIQWTYNPSTKAVTVTGAVSASDALYVGSYDAKGQMVSLELITSSGGTAQAASGANSIMMFWLDSNLVPKCGKQAIRTT